MAKTKADVVETMKSSIDSQIDGNRQHGWGQKDSMAVIGDMLAEFSGEIAAKNNEVHQAVLAGINQLVNPSACRQWLESEKVDKLDKSEGRAAKATKLFAEF